MSWKHPARVKSGDEISVSFIYTYLFMEHYIV